MQISSPEAIDASVAFQLRRSHSLAFSSCEVITVTTSLVTAYSMRSIQHDKLFPTHNGPPSLPHPLPSQWLCGSSRCSGMFSTEVQAVIPDECSEPDCVCLTNYCPQVLPGKGRNPQGKKIVRCIEFSVSTGNPRRNEELLVVAAAEEEEKKEEIARCLLTLSLIHI